MRVCARVKPRLNSILKPLPDAPRSTAVEIADHAQQTTEYTSAADLNTTVRPPGRTRRDNKAAAILRVPPKQLGNLACAL